MRDVVSRLDTSGRELSQARASFAAELMQLKQEGCCVLVTSRANESVRAVQSRQLFGSVDASRQRTLTLTDSVGCDSVPSDGWQTHCKATETTDIGGSEEHHNRSYDATSTGLSRYLPDGISADHSPASALDHREVVLDATDVTNTQLWPSVDDSTTLCESVRTVVQNPAADPGELRLGVATLGALVAIDGCSATQAFVCAVRTDLIGVHGIAHVHLPGTPDSETLTTLRPEIDIHIELRESHGAGEPRWHLLDSELSTDWFPL